MTRLSVVILSLAALLLGSCSQQDQGGSEPWPKACHATYSIPPNEGCPVAPHHLYSDGMGKVRVDYEELTTKGGGLIEPDYSNAIKQLNVTVYDLKNRECLSWDEGPIASHTSRRDQYSNTSGYFYDSVGRNELRKNFQPLGEKEINGHHCVGYKYAAAYKPNSSAKEFWIDEDPGYQGILVKRTDSTYPKLSDNLTDFSPAPPDQGLFKPPLGYESQL